VFRLPEAWVWDFWTADDGQDYHLFFLYASRALKDPDARHNRASIGHAVSSDLVRWERVADVVVRSDPPAFDDVATWTGSVIRHPDGTWFLFYTGATLAPDGKNVQRIGYATSPDLLQWEKAAGGAVLAADPRWYERLDAGLWHDEAFRDPFVFADPDSDGWHMLITARANHGPADDRGVLGHAWSADLRRWELRPPLSEPGQGFGQLEVPQVHTVNGRPVLLFSSLGGGVAKRRNTYGGIWAASADSLLGPYDITNAQVAADPSMYVGRLVQLRNSDDWVFMAFYDTVDGTFVGQISDPQPVTWDGRVLHPAPLFSGSAAALGER
jgi:sucrose-6-phosphate hydrolase SacC (GH32 family)